MTLGGALPLDLSGKKRSVFLHERQLHVAFAKRHRHLGAILYQGLRVEMQRFYGESCVRGHRSWQVPSQDYVALWKRDGEPSRADLERIQQINLGGLRAIRGVTAESVVRPLVR